MTVRVFKCPCGDKACNKWMVSPGADRQGCGWEDKATAERVAAAIDNTDWKLVPAEPTYQMCEAGKFAWEHPAFPKRYKAMVEAAPKVTGYD